jgi:hypothetical protein
VNAACWCCCCVLALAGCSWRSGFDTPELACDESSRDCPDAGASADAAPGTAVTITFGERRTSDVTDVTFDTYLSSSNPDDNKGAKEAWYASTADARHALLRFDLSAIAPDAVVVSASLSLWTTDYASGGALRLYEMLESWDEGDEDDAPGVSNWYFRQPQRAWSGVGATPPSSGNLPVAELEPDTFFTEITAPLPASLVQGWVSSPAANFGVTFVAASSDGDFGFSSREADLPDFRPELTVTFVP